MTYQISARIAPWIDAAIEAHGQGEPVHWDCALVPQPAPASAGIMVAMWLPGAELGTHAMVMAIFQSPPTIDVALVDETVAGLLENLRASRSAELRRSLAAQNGHGHPGTPLPGLLDPGTLSGPPGGPG